MANARGRKIDNTHLSIDQAERRGFLHRDYIAHCLRWSHVVKYVNAMQRYKTACVLDIGCGVDLPLAKTFYSSRLILEEYVGVDYNDTHKFDMEAFHTGKMPVHAYGGVDFAKDVKGPVEHNGAPDLYWVGDIGSHKLPTVITCFEVLEHIEPEHVVRMLHRMLSLLVASETQGNEVVAFVSTPCYDPHTGAAANHVNEMKRDALGWLIEETGFQIDGNWGTFASMKDYRDDMFFRDYGDIGREIWEKLSGYYDSNYLATVLAPMYPEGSRNNLWQLSPARKGYERKFRPIGEVEEPWTSSEMWKDMIDWQAADEVDNG